jgi:hypothetical protein
MTPTHLSASAPNDPTTSIPWHRRVSWPLVLGLALFALTRPVLSITGLADEWGKPATPLIATALITAVWVVAAARFAHRAPVLTLVVTALAYAAFAVVLSAILSPMLDGQSSKVVTNPIALLGVLSTNLVWGLVAGGLAALLTARRR